MTDEELEAWSERAAILEYEAGFSRATAELLAQRMFNAKEVIQ